MINENKAQVEEQLALFETKVERAYDVSEKKEIELIIKKIHEMSSNIKKILFLDMSDEQKQTWENLIGKSDSEIEKIILHLIESTRKQEKQESIYNVSHLFSKTLDKLIDSAEEIKTICVAQARNCVGPIDNVFKQVEEMYKESLDKICKNISAQVLSRITYEIRKCGNEIQSIHSEQTYWIENSIASNAEKMVKNLETIKEKSETETSHMKIKGGVTNSQNGKYSLSDIIASKTEIVSDIPKRSSLDDFFV